ncbi:MAG: leucyl aminopeptidase family protein [Planctomycetota bacterium]
MFESVSIGGRGTASVAVIGQFKGEDLDPRSAAIDPDAYAEFAAGQNDATGEVGSVLSVFPADGYERVFIVGLGDREGFKPGALRNVAGALARTLARAMIDDVELRLHDAVVSLNDPPSKSDCGRALGEGLGLASWNYDELRGEATDVPERWPLTVRCEDEAFEDGLKTGVAIAAGSNLCRTLSQTPPNIATPEWIAEQCKKLARETRLKCSVISGDKLLDEDLTGIFTVGQASENEPCFVRLEYRPTRIARSAKPFVLVGKTMTYDSGGLSIKVGGSMRGMKRDKDGGCAVIGAMHTIATVIKPDIPVVALLSCAENSISDEAYRPDDVITFRNGVTVEVTNTDAEGRLVMADALCWACEKENPAAIIDMATLTGGVVVALGKVFAGLWCDDDKLRAAVEEAGQATGERVWRLPHDPAYREMMRSPIADIVNSAPVREAHPIQGAAFLSYFCEEGIPWAHVDIAGVHAIEKDQGPLIPGPTGFGARLAAEAIARFAAAD